MVYLKYTVYWFTTFSAHCWYNYYSSLQYGKISRFSFKSANSEPISLVWFFCGSFSHQSDPTMFIRRRLSLCLFTSVPLKRTIDLILKRVFEDKMVNTTLTKRTLKKLLLDSCTKTAFSFNNEIYQQIEGLSVGSCWHQYWQILSLRNSRKK